MRTALLFAVHGSLAAQSGDTLVHVGEGAPSPSAATIADALRRVSRHGHVIVHAGVYAESTLVILRPVRITGQPGAILDGQGARGLVIVNSDSVALRGLTFRNTGTSHTDDRAAIRIFESIACVVERNQFESTFFALHLQRVDGCVVRENRMRGLAGSQSTTGNGVHVWSSRNVRVEHNTITGHRDGIYFEFSRLASARQNVVTESLRYGLHFMFSDSCAYESNRFVANRSGVAVMYAKHVRIADNLFSDARNSASYGLLLKEINDSQIVGNDFLNNTIAVHLEGANRNQVSGNRFEANGWAMRLLADAQENQIRDNSFYRNVFDLSTNSQSHFSTVRGNYWDRYRGYDLNRDGVGDVPHAPVRLFALVVERAPSALLLVRSAVADALDLLERIAPALTPATLLDQAPRMRPLVRAPSAQFVPAGQRNERAS
jgi:nitrous oxidase accessory protein